MAENLHLKQEKAQLQRIAYNELIGKYVKSFPAP